MVTFVHKKSPLSRAWLSLVSLLPLSHVAEELPILHESGAVVVKHVQWLEIITVTCVRFAAGLGEGSLTHEV